MYYFIKHSLARLLVYGTFLKEGISQTFTKLNLRKVLVNLQKCFREVP